MPAMQPTADQFRGFRDDPHDGPVVQINLLKFKVKADYPADAAEHPGNGGGEVSGAEAYWRYATAFEEAAVEVGGDCLLMGSVERYFIGGGDWDAVFVNRFPNRAAFIATLNHDGYHEMHRHRDAGLLCQELLTVRPDRATGRL